MTPRERAMEAALAELADAATREDEEIREGCPCATCVAVKAAIVAARAALALPREEEREGEVSEAEIEQLVGALKLAAFDVGCGRTGYDAQDEAEVALYAAIARLRAARKGTAGGEEG